MTWEEEGEEKEEERGAGEYMKTLHLKPSVR